MKMTHIKSALKVLGITQAEAAQHLGTKRTTLSAVLNDAPSVKPDDLIRIQIGLVELVNKEAAKQRDELVPLVNSLGGVAHAE